MRLERRLRFESVSRVQEFRMHMFRHAEATRHCVGRPLGCCQYVLDCCLVLVLTVADPSARTTAFPAHLRQSAGACVVLVPSRAAEWTAYGPQVLGRLLPS